MRQVTVVKKRLSILLKLKCKEQRNKTAAHSSVRRSLSGSNSRNTDKLVSWKTYVAVELATREGALNTQNVFFT